MAGLESSGLYLEIFYGYRIDGGEYMGEIALAMFSFCAW